MKQKNKLSLIAMVLGILAVIFMVSLIVKSDISGNSAESIGTALGIMIILPCVFMISIAVILNIIGYLLNNRVLTLISAIFYTIGLVIMPLWGFVGIPSMVLQYIAFSQMKRINSQQQSMPQNPIDPNHTEKIDTYQTEQPFYKKWYGKALIGVGVLFLILFTGSMFSKKTPLKQADSTEEVKTEQTAKVTEKKSENKKNEETVIALNQAIEFDGFKITVTGYQLAKDYEGKPALIVSYNWENTSDKSQSPFMTFTLNGFQDGVQTDNTLFVDNVDLGLGQKEIKPGGKIENAQTIVGITDLDKPLDIELEEAFSFSDITYKATLDLKKLEATKKQETTDRQIADKEDPGKYDKDYYMRVYNGIAYKLNHNGYTPDGQYFSRFDSRRSDFAYEPPGDIGDLQNANNFVGFDQSDIDSIYSYHDPEPSYSNTYDNSYDDNYENATFYEDEGEYGDY